MATRKRCKDPEPAADLLPLDVDSLAAFMAIEQPDRDRLATALHLATTGAAAAIGRSLNAYEPHAIRHGAHMLAAHLLISDDLEAAPLPAEIPLTIRYLLRSASAGHQPV